MKSTILFATITGCILFSSAANAQKLKGIPVPEAIKAALFKKYPTATNVAWEKEKKAYEANWGGKSGENMSVLFGPGGTFIEQVELIPINSLPVGISKYVATKYKGTKILEAGKVTDAKGQTMYKAEIKAGDLLFDANGNFIKID